MLPTELPVLEHPPVLLREFTGADVGLVQSVARDPLIPLITTVPVSGTAADARAFIARQHDRLATGAGYSFAIADAAAGEAAGQIGLYLRDLPEGRADIGYWVAPQFRRRGYVSAALAVIARWGLSLDGVHRLQLHVEPWNEGSWRAAERAGFVREGLLRSWQRVGAGRRDMYVYSLLREDLA
jgi:[ribosomal protein S5]-alanine N-acetyltransferase